MLRRILSAFLALLLLGACAVSAAGVIGDVNDDGAVNAKDVTVLRRYIAGGYGVTPEKETADVNSDGAVNAKDVTVLRRYIAGGYGVTLETVPENFILIPANPDFTFICNTENTVGQGEASPITAPYYLCRYMTTNAEYLQFLTETGRTNCPRYWQNGVYPEGKANHPVLWVSYEDAEAYCAWLGTKYPDWQFRLPTEAEYENAAAGPSRYTYPWGNSTDNAYDGTTLTSKMNYNGVVAAYCLQTETEATYVHEKSVKLGQTEPLTDIITISRTGGVSGWVNHSDYTGFIYTDIFARLSETGGYTVPVDAYPEGVSAYGLYNMSGNAYSWTSSVIIAVNGAEKGQSVNAVRGGSWYATAASCKATFRGEGRKPSGTYSTIGFRVAATRQ